MPRASWSDSKELLLSFGYGDSLDRHPLFARFDVRDEVCVDVGGFKHGEVVKDRGGSEFVVVGARPVCDRPIGWAVRI